MYLTARITIDLSNTAVELRPPSNFFGGVASVLTKGRWSTQEEIETYKLLAFAQSTYRALRDVGVSDVLRVAIGNEVIYEDFDERPDDFELAMEELERRLRRGVEPEPTKRLDLVLRHQDNVLTYVIDLSFRREHKLGEHPVDIRITAVPAELRRLTDETNAAHEQRMKAQFETQEQLDDATARWRAQLDRFVATLEGHFSSTLGIDGVTTLVSTAIPSERGRISLAHALTYGLPFYGFAMADLLYLSMWDLIWQRNLNMHDTYYGDPWTGGYYVGDEGWDYGVAQMTTPPVTTASIYGHGQPPGTDVLDQFASNPADAPTGGGWFGNLHGFFDVLDVVPWGGDGGDISSDDSSGGDSGSSCGSCGGGGCGGGGGD